MRIAGMCFARLRDHSGRYALLLNRGHLQYNDARILSPIGGGLKLYPEGRRYLETLGASDFEGTDVRLYVPDNATDRAIAWFRSRKQRERSVLRELVEELTDETDILSAAEVRGAIEQIRDYRRFNATTTRRMVRDSRTAYLVEVFNVTLPPVAMKILATAAMLPVQGRWLHFVTEAEIKAGVSRDGVAIEPITATIL